MSAPGINCLPEKFQPFLIGSSACDADIKNEIDALFENGSTKLQRYIFDAGKWILKLGCRDEGLTGSDTHLYRVRKAEKIRSYIQQNHLEAHLAVPKKYIYQNKNNGPLYVVAEKMDLSSEVGATANDEIEAAFKQGAAYGGQLRALAKGAPKRCLTLIQAEALAKLSILGYTNLSYNNLYFTKDGKVAVIDTQPQARRLKKRLKANFLTSLLQDAASLLSIQSIIGINELKSCIDDPTTLQAVEKIEQKHALWSLTKLIAKIFTVTLAIYFVPIATALIPVAAVATTLKVALLVFAYAKNLSLICTAFAICFVFRFRF